MKHVQLVLGDCSVDSIANVDQGVDALQVDVCEEEGVVITDAIFFSLLFVVQYDSIVPNKFLSNSEGGNKKRNIHRQAFFCAESIQVLAKKMQDKAVLAF